MISSLRIVSNRKGSNPGGFAYLNDLYVYVKYSFIGENLTGTPLKVEHQPIYEYITGEILKFYGFKVPKRYVIEGERIKIINEINNPDFYKKRPYYLLSVYVKYEPNGKFDISQKCMLDKLGMCDIIGKGDNYGMIEEGSFIIIDCGCSFVESVNGRMRVKEEYKRAYNEQKIKIKSRKIKKEISKIIKYIGDITIDTYFSNIPINKILNKDEIEFIKSYYIWKMCQ